MISGISKAGSGVTKKRLENQSNPIGTGNKPQVARSVDKVNSDRIINASRTYNMAKNAVLGFNGLAAKTLSPANKIGFAANPRSSEELGPHWNPEKKQWEMGVCAPNAERVRLCAYTGPVGKEAYTQDKTADQKEAHDVYKFEVPVDELVEAGAIQKVDDPVHYGYRAWGPNWKYDPDWKPGGEEGFIADVDENGNRYNPNKLLVDPYAKEISHDPVSPKVQGDVKDPAYYYATGPAHRRNDSAPIAPKSLAFHPKPVKSLTEEEKRIARQTKDRPLKDEIIYEAHVRGLTMRDESIPPELRGTYKGAAMKAAELAKLGVTAVEFLPIQESQNDGNDVGKESNYWGYSTINWHAPDRRFSSDKTPGGPTKEVKEMIQEFHRHGIKVILDTVDNHTSEGGTWNGDPNVATIHSLRGLDNSAYYVTCSNGQQHWNNSGCGADTNSASEPFRDLAVDSDKYWVKEMDADGFRFDLGTINANGKLKDGYEYAPDDPNNIPNRLAKELPQNVVLIDEPWACGEGTYQVGNPPNAGFSQWNDKFRDTMRKMENKVGVEDVTPAEVARRVAGSSDLYHHDGGTPSQSVNFVTAHDGFTLKDLHSYNNKNNIGSDGGSDNNISWDHNGNQGAQRQAVRNSMFDLMLSRGTPMIVAGDESLRSTNGNNNPYNLDTPVNYQYHGWKRPKNLQDQLIMANAETTHKLIQFRQDHPAIKGGNFFNGQDNDGNGIKDVAWYTPDGHIADGNYMDNPNNRFLGERIDCRDTRVDQPDNPEAQKHESIYVARNWDPNGVMVKLPEPSKGKKWYVAGDTQEDLEGQNMLEPGKEIPLDRNEYFMKGRTRLLLVEK